MFVPPPIQRHHEAQATLGATSTSLYAETSNSLRSTLGNEHQLVLGEGAYSLRDELTLAQPPANPYEALSTNTNPLETEPGPVTALTTLSTIKVVEDLVSGLIPPLARDTSGRLPDLAPHTQATAASDSLDLQSSTSVFGSENPALNTVSVVKDANHTKRRKPKSGLVKSTSTFVHRVMLSDALPKRLADRNASGLFAMANVGRALQWLDLSAENKADYLTKLYFSKGHVLCHDFNDVTKSAVHLDTILGFNTSDVIWYEPVSQKYSRLNKNGVINASPVMCVKWLPNSENLFMAAHLDGSLIVYDKEKDDAPFAPEDPSSSELDESFDPTRSRGLLVKKSVRCKHQKTNPVSVWQVSHQSIRAMAFSPDGTHLAVTCEDGTLRIINMLAETLIDVYRSFYGGLTAVTWSPDGKYILTGGQDDLVSIWSFFDRSLVARCSGHSSWVTDVKFDPWRCDERGYRFGSVGQDCKLLMWDFSLGMIRKPKALSIHHRGSIASGSVNQKDTVEAESIAEDDIFHPLEPRLGTAVLPPVMSKQIDDSVLASLTFQHDCVIVTSKDGRVRTWDRPAHGMTADE